MLINVKNMYHFCGMSHSFVYDYLPCIGIRWIKCQSGGLNIQCVDNK